MSQEFPQVEQDRSGDGDLPTYDDLSAQSGPNSRFGRWQQWIEKRAAERYADDSTDGHRRRRNRGWGHSNARSDTEVEPSVVSFATDAPIPSYEESTRGSSSAINRAPSTISATRSFATSDSPTVLVAFALPYYNGLPVMGDRYLLLGNEEGLDVLDMMPEDSYEGNPRDAKARPIWRGESVCQIAQLEQAEPDATRTPQGVVLMLISPESIGATQDGKEPMRTLRMYKLASLVSLVRLMTLQTEMEPIDLSRASSPMDQAVHKHHHHHHHHHHGRTHSLVKSLKGLHVDSAPSLADNLQSLPIPEHDRPPPVPPKDLDTLSMRSLGPAQTSRADSMSSIDTNSWDVIDDLPLRWATDFVPLATPGSRLFGQSVLTFAVSKPQDGMGRTLLAIATKTNIFLYDTPQGTRTFRYVKEFYTPLPARSLSFIAQVPRDNLGRTTSQHPTPKHHDTGDRLQARLAGQEDPHSPSRPRASTNSNSPPQLSLFLTFDKKAGLIRISDAAVSELELWEEPSSSGLSMPSIGHGTFRRSLASLESIGFNRDPRGPWLPLATVSLPAQRAASVLPLMESVYLLSRGKSTHIVPCPLPIPLAARPPLRVLRWKMQPNDVHARLIRPPGGAPPTLQVIAFGEDGVEVQELTLEALLNRPLVTNSPGKGKGKLKDEVDIIRSQADVGGACGFLVVGGNWEDPLGFAQNLYRSDSVRSMDSVDVVAQRRGAQGVYGWCAKGWEANDYRAFWLGEGIDREEM
ncbi:hypothetical protein BKA62DRAFT_690359 [Auriculariales sp. MPI-PUGE-AT-0066]|nr:hypothetical protein BKA62DRAFT_690359 [Auriculariales sp. MPI-PUGE-AT-0066]